MSDHFKEYGVYISQNIFGSVYVIPIKQFRNFYTGYIHYIVDQEEAFLRNRASLLNINYNITSRDLIALASIISKEFDPYNISSIVKHFPNDDNVSSELLKIISCNLSGKSKMLFESFFVMKFILDTPDISQNQEKRTHNMQFACEH